MRKDNHCRIVCSTPVPRELPTGMSTDHSSKKSVPCHVSAQASGLKCYCGLFISQFTVSKLSVGHLAPSTKEVSHESLGSWQLWPVVYTCYTWHSSDKVFSKSSCLAKHAFCVTQYEQVSSTILVDFHALRSRCSPADRADTAGVMYITQQPLLW